MQLPAIPAPLRELIARLPQYPPAAAAAFALNLLLGHVINANRLPGTRRKVIAIAVRDAGLCLAFRIEDEGLAACGRGTPPDVTIRADLGDLLALVRRETDPDTLFFSRRLVMEGDTELGLLMKNTLDSVDIGALSLPPVSRVPAAVELSLRNLFAPCGPETRDARGDRAETTPTGARGALT